MCARMNKVLSVLRYTELRRLQISRHNRVSVLIEFNDDFVKNSYMFRVITKTKNLKSFERLVVFLFCDIYDLIHHWLDQVRFIFCVLLVSFVHTLKFIEVYLISGISLSSEPLAFPCHSCAVKSTFYLVNK